MNVNPINMPMLPSVVIESPSTLPATTSALELPEPEGQQDIEVWHASSFVSYEKFCIANLSLHNFNFHLNLQ
jgi:hypothetical protein